MREHLTPSSQRQHQVANPMTPDPPLAPPPTTSAPPPTAHPHPALPRLHPHPRPRARPRRSSNHRLPRRPQLLRTLEVLLPHLSRHLRYFLYLLPHAPPQRLAITSTR